MKERGWSGRIAGALLVVTTAMGAPPRACAEPIRVETFSVPLSASHPKERQVGELTFLGGLELRSAAKGFGGFSGLHISQDGTRLLAVSDMGYWLQARLVHGPDGALAGMRDARLTPMRGLNGKRITGKALGDAEDLAVTGDGILVSFERRHRVWRYPYTDDLSRALPTVIPTPAKLATVQSNKGIESLVFLPGRRLLLITEESLDRDGNIRGWLSGRNARSWAALRLRRSPPFAASGAALLPGNRELLILERRYSPLGGLGIKLRRLPVSDLAPGALLTGTDIAEFAPGQTIDNFEGIATRPDRNGGAIVYLLSDDNFNSFQHTFLLNFRLKSAVSSVHR